MKVLFLGRLADTVGAAEQSVELPGDVRDVDALRSWLGDQIPALLDPKLRLIVNNVLAQPGQVVTTVDEVAFFPPVSGG